MRDLVDGIWSALQEVAMLIVEQIGRWLCDGAAVTPPIAAAFVAVFFLVFRRKRSYR